MQEKPKTYDHVEYLKESIDLLALALREAKAGNIQAALDALNCANGRLGAARDWQIAVEQD